MPLKLTPRQSQVATLVAQGLSNKEIAFRLELTQGTIKEYIFQTFKKLKISNRTELAIWELNRSKAGPG